MVPTTAGHLVGSRGWRIGTKRNSFTSSSAWNNSISRVHFVSPTGRIKRPGKHVKWIHYWAFNPIANYFFFWYRWRNTESRSNEWDCSIPHLPISTTSANKSTPIVSVSQFQTKHSLALPFISCYQLPFCLPQLRCESVTTTITSPKFRTNVIKLKFSNNVLFLISQCRATTNIFHVNSCAAMKYLMTTVYCLWICFLSILLFILFIFLTESPPPIQYLFLLIKGLLIGLFEKRSIS